MPTILCLVCKVRTASHPSGRCARHRALQQQRIDSDPCRRDRKRALYGPDHDAARKAWAPIVAAGGRICRRCGEPIEAGADWDLGHGEGSEPEHPPCNRGDRRREEHT